MKGLPFVLLFTAMTFVAWGAYGPVLHHGERDSMRAFVGVGLAYFMVAVLIPILILRSSGEVGRWTITGTIYSLIAGAVGAIGALGIILALGYGGQPVYVMPLVFGFAPVVNTLVTAMLSRTFNQVRPIFVIGIVTAALGAGGVLAFKPSPKAAATTPELNGNVAPGGDAGTPADLTEPAPAEPAPAEPAPAEPAPAEPAPVEPAPTTPESTTPKRTGEAAEANSPPAANDSAATAAPPQFDRERYVVKRVAFVAPLAAPLAVADSTDTTSSALANERTLNFWGVVVSIIVAALCWGSYGPMLHIGQAKMSGSRLRPFTCVGLAYFFIAVAAPLVVIYSRGTDTGVWTAGGMTWSFLAGVAGAIGALGVILAFNAGGKPYYVMPLIFGFAPVINTCISLSEAGTWSQVRFGFWISLAVVITGAVIVLTNAPRPKPHAAK